jgi:hypothetical protein
VSSFATLSINAEYGNVKIVVSVYEFGDPLDPLHSHMKIASDSLTLA